MQPDALNQKRHRVFRSRYPDRVTGDVVTPIVDCYWPARLRFDLSGTDLPITDLVFESRQTNSLGYFPGGFHVYGNADGAHFPTQIPAGERLFCTIYDKLGEESAHRITYTYDGETKTYEFKLATFYTNGVASSKFVWHVGDVVLTHNYDILVAPIHSGPFDITIDATDSDLDVTSISARVAWIVPQLGTDTTGSNSPVSLPDVTAGTAGSPHTFTFTGNARGWHSIAVAYTVGGQQRHTTINRPRPSDPASATVAVVFNAEPPSALALNNTYLLNGTSATEAVGSFSCADADSTADEITYSLVDGVGGGDNNHFSITSDGVLYSLFVANYASKSSYAIRVRATDQTGLYCEQTFTISVFAALEFIGLTDKTYGDAPFALQSKHRHNTAVAYAVISGPATIFGSTLTITGVGIVTVQVQQGWDAVQASFNVAKKALTVTAVDATRSYGAAEPIFQTTLAGFVNSESADLVVAGAASVTTNASNASAPGDYTLTPALGTLFAANYSFTFVPGTLVVTKAAQSITFGALPITTPIAGLESLAVSATSSSGLPVALTLEAGSVATLSGSPGSYALDTVGETGTVTLQANQAGNSNYLAASEVVRVVVVTKQDQTITFTAPEGLDEDSGPVTLNGVASSELAVAYTVISGPASVSGSTLTVSGAGTVVVKASQSGDATYNAALDVSRAFSVAPASGESIIPPHSGYSSDFGTVSADAEHFSLGQTYAAHRAFDGNTADTVWSAAANGNAGVYGTLGWLLSYAFTDPQVVRGYAIHGCPNRSAWYNYTPPRTWTFEGWNGSSWVVLDRQVGHATGTGSFFFNNDNNVTYSKIRLNVTDGQVNEEYGQKTGIQIAELQVF